MPHFWMTYRDSGRLVGLVIMEAPSLVRAGLKAIRGVGAGATFAEGHELSTDQTALVPAGKIGRMLSTDEAERCSPSSGPAKQASSGLASLKK
jgi:hypothetical protein